MFDLNEIPEQPQARLEAEDHETAPAAVDGVTKSEISGNVSHPSVNSDHVKGQAYGGGEAVAAATTLELLAPKRLLSSLTFEPLATKRQNGSDSTASLVRHLPSSYGEDEDEEEEAGQRRQQQQQQQRLQHQRQRASPRDGIQETDLLISTRGNAYRFIGGGADASTSRKHEDLLDEPPVDDQDDLRTPTILSLKRTPEPRMHQLKDVGGQASAEGSAFGLSLGSSFHSSQAPRPSDLKRCSSKKPNLFGLALGRAEEGPLASRKSSDLSPFWRGKLRTDAPLLTPVVAYCLGIMKPDSRLKKLPTVLSSRKFVKLEEFQKILRNGVAEPLTQFKPSLKASMEEVKRFNLMVEALSHGSGLMQSPSVRGLELGQQSLSANATFPYSAALVSWEEDADYSLDAKLYLISSPSFQVVLKNCQSNTSLGALEEIDVLDPESLYGIFCRSSSSMVTDNLDRLQTGDQDVGRRIAVSTNEGSDTSPSATADFTERGRDTVATNSIAVPMASPSCNKHHVARSEVLTKSASMEPNRVSSRDANSRFDFEEAGRGSKKRYHRQLSSIDMIHEAGGKHHSRYSNGANDLYEEDIGMLSYQQVQSKQREKFNWNYGRHSQRQEWRNDRSKDTIRWSKEDRDLGKNRVKEHQRHSNHEGERGWKSKAMEGEQHRNQDKAWHKEKEKSLKENISEDSKIKFVSEKSLAGSKSFLHRASPDHESGKLNKKRDREGENEHIVHMKRLRESEVTALPESDQLVRDTSCDLKCKSEVEQVNQEDCPLQKEPEPAEKPAFTEPNIESHHLDEGMAKTLFSHGSFDGISGVKTIESHCLDEGMAKLLLIHGSLDGILGVKNEANGASVSETEGVTEMDTGFNLLKMSTERIGMMEDGVPSKWDETLGDSPMAKVEKEDEKEETSLEFLLDGFDKETRTWLMSKQNSLYLQEEYGVDATINPDVSNLNSGSKTDSQYGPLQVRISMATSEFCDAAEAKWFVDQAAGMVKSIASRGVFIKCLWYEGPVQIHAGDGAPSVPVIVKKIKGEDGKNLERMQDATGVMIGVVLRKGGVAAPHEAEPMSRPRFIGLRLKCLRRKGLLEASKQAEALLECVAEHFSKELATHIATHIADLQESALHQSESVSNQDSPSNHAISTKELLPNSPVKAEGQMGHGSPGSPKKDEATLAASLDEANAKVSNTSPPPKEEPEASLPSELKEVASRPLYVSNLPEHITAIKIRNIFENILKEKLGPSGDFESGSELVADVRYIPDKFCAFVELANDDLLNTSLKLYAEDKNVFHGLSVELGLSANTKTERQSSFSRGGARNRGSNSGEHARPSFSARNKGEDYGRRQYEEIDNESDSDYSHDLWYAENVATRTDHFLDKPRPLFLSELMRNASAQTIKQLFEDIITTYIGPSLVSSSGRQLVLDVRYVPSRGCAFVDLATPELVEFMLDLHSRRPDVFLNMKMELGRRPVPYSVEDDAERRLNMRSRDAMHGKSQYGSQSYGYRLTTSASRKKTEKRPNGSFNDYLEDSDKSDDFSRQSARLKKQRSDPEKTIYVDRLPESASEGMIRKIFERVLLQNLSREELDVFGEHMITEVRHVPTKYCAFVVFVTEDLTRMVLHLYNQDEDAFESMRLKPHFHSRMEDLYKEDLQEIDEVVHPTASFRERVVNLDIDDYVRPRQVELYDPRSRSAAHRAVTASAFKEVDRRRSVYVDRIPEDLSEFTMTEMFEKVFRHKKHGYDGHMVSQVAYFRDKFDPSKLCAFVEVKTEDGTQDLVDFYNTNPDGFQGMRVRPGFKYNN